MSRLEAGQDAVPGFEAPQNRPKDASAGSNALGCANDGCAVLDGCEAGCCLVELLGCFSSVLLLGLLLVGVGGFVLARL
ncbi:hypothetical protein EON81_19620 [bacterium]|nr:MAG: hypothetical protein EON81_19620 [bacterium]